MRRFLVNFYQRWWPWRITPSPSLKKTRPRSVLQDSISAKFANDICNEHFRLVTHLAQLEKMPDPPRQIRRLRTSVEALQYILAQQGIEYLDLTGQDYHEGRRDFENIAIAAIDPTLTTAKIVVCEYPAIFLQGKLIQTARGIVARPPSIINN